MNEWAFSQSLELFAVLLTRTLLFWGFTFQMAVIYDQIVSTSIFLESCQYIRYKYRDPLWFLIFFGWI